MNVKDEENFMGFLGVVYIICFIIALVLKVFGILVLRWAAVFLYPLLACYAIIVALLLLSILVKIIMWK